MTEPSKAGASSPSFADLFEKSVRQIKEGEVVRGRVLSVDEENVQIDA